MLLEKIWTPTILVMDAMEFRRAGVLCSLEAWAAAIGAAARGATPENFEEEMPDDADILLVVLSLGGLPLASENAQRWLGRIRTVLPGRPVAILSDIETPDEAASASQAGAQGLLPTSLKPSVVLHALAFIRDGGTYFSPAALLKPDAALHHPAGGGKRPSTAEGEADGLTPRQQEVLILLQFGRSNKLIARALDIQESTVKVHVRQIMRKLGAANRTQAALMAAKAHLKKGDGARGAQPAENGAAASPSAVPGRRAARAPCSMTRADALPRREPEIHPSANEQEIILLARPRSVALTGATELETPTTLSPRSRSSPKSTSHVGCANTRPSNS